MRILPREVENFFHVADGDAVPERAALGRVTGRSRQGRQCIASAKGMPRDFGADHPTDIRRSGTRALRWSHLVTSPKHFRQRCTLHSLQAVCGRCGLPPRSGVRRVPLSPRSPVVARPEHARHVLCLGKYATGWRCLSYAVTTDSARTNVCSRGWPAAATSGSRARLGRRSGLGMQAGLIPPASLACLRPSRMIMGSPARGREGGPPPIRPSRRPLRSLLEDEVDTTFLGK